MSLQITLLRHGRPDKSLPNHRLHTLSEEGRRQALERRAKLGNPEFDLVLHSELIRTRETASIIAGLDKSPATDVVCIPELFYKDEDSLGQVVERMFAKLGHTTLQKYYEEAREEMRSLAETADRAIGTEIIRFNAHNVLVVGHGMLLQSACIARTGQDEPFMSRILGECEGYRLTLQDGGTYSVEIID